MKDIVSNWMSRWEFVVGILTIVVLFKFNRGIWGLIEDTSDFLGTKIGRQNTAEAKE